MAVLVSMPTGDETIQEIRKPADRTLPDSILLERSMDGEREAFGELARRHFRVVYATALSILGVPEEAEDACQEALIKAFRYIRTLKDNNKFVFWVRSIVRQESITRLQKKSRTITLLKKISRENQPGLVISHSNKQRRMYHQQLLQQAIQPLSEKAREIVLLHYVSGMSCEEIAALMGTRAGTIKSHLFKARQKMLNHLSEIGVHSIDDI